MERQNNPRKSNLGLKRVKNWNVDFKLHAPQNTTIEATLKNGEITRLKVTPA